MVFTLKMDNQSAITVFKNPDLRLYWLRDKVEHGMLNPDFIPTGDMIADCLTKSVPAPKVQRTDGCFSLNIFFLFLLIYLDRHVGVRVMVTCDCIYID